MLFACFMQIQIFHLLFLFSGYLSDTTGSYDVSFYVAGACIVAAGVLYVILSKVDTDNKNKKQDEDVENI
jgi:hypothetical protein